MKRIAVRLIILVVAVTLSASMASAATATITNIMPYNEGGFYCPYGANHCFGAGKLARVTVQMDGMKYSADFNGKWGSHLTVGDSIDARIENDKLILTDSNGRTEKSKIVRREQLAPSLLNSPELRFVCEEVRSGVGGRQSRPGHTFVRERSASRPDGEDFGHGSARTVSGTLSSGPAVRSTAVDGEGDIAEQVLEGPAASEVKANTAGGVAHAGADFEEWR